MPQPPKMNPALARIQQIKSKAGSGFGSSFEETEPFINPIIQQAAEEIKAEQKGPVEVMPPLEEDQDEARVAMRLIALQAEGVGPVAPTRTAIYTGTTGGMDRMTESLEQLVQKKIILPE